MPFWQLQLICAIRLFKIKHAQHTCLQIADQKVALSIQSYDLIDNHVRRLDHDLERLENELKQEGDTVAVLHRLRGYR